MKYIDAEKLKAEIERHIKHYESSNRDDFKNGELYICQELLSIIDSLQQEQPKRICPRCVFLNKTDDVCEFPYGGRRCYINENGVYECNRFTEVEKQEQPEVDLEKEIDICFEKYIKDAFGIPVAGRITKFEITEIARHFYELGKNSK